jgi:hypothetical protein
MPLAAEVRARQPARVHVPRTPIEFIYREAREYLE